MLAAKADVKHACTRMHAMVKPVVVLLAAVCCLGLADSAVWLFAYKPLSGSYAIYGGFPDAAIAPTPGDAKIAFNLRGNAATEMFNAMGPDSAGSCGPQGGRVRQRDMILCRYRSVDGYACRFGFDLSTGLSIGGAGCAD